MGKIIAAILTTSLCVSALAAPSLAAGKKKAAAKKCSAEFMYVDKKSGKCMDARLKKG